MTAAQTEQQPAEQASSIIEQGKPVETYDWIAEKHRVKGEDGSINVEASARKVAEAYSHLEKRFGSGDVPPKTAEEYDLKVETEGFNFDEFKADPESQSFLKSAHAKGLTNDQVSFVIGEFYKRAPQLIAGNEALDTEAVTKELRQEWKSEEDFKANISSAYKAFNAYASEADKARMNEIGNNPIVLRLLANIGKEMREDKPVTSNLTVDSLDFDTKASELRKQLGSLDKNDPKRKQIQIELDTMYQKRYG